MRSFCYENQFSCILKLELITITTISHLASLWKRDWEELGNGLFSALFAWRVVRLLCDACSSREIYIFSPQLLTTCSRHELQNILKARMWTTSQLFIACKVLPADKSLFIGLLLPRAIRSSSLCSMSSTRKSGSSDVQTLRSGMKKRRLSGIFFNQLLNVWISVFSSVWYSFSKH